MVFIRKCDSSMRNIEPKYGVERCELWTRCLRSSKRDTRKVDWKFIEMKLFGSYESSSSGSLGSGSPSDRETNLVSTSLSPTRFVMVLSTSNQSSFCEVVTKIDSICLKYD